MLKVKIHEFAHNELLAAKDWYDLQVKNLGSVFQNSIKKQVNIIRQHPSWFLVE